MLQLNGCHCRVWGNVGTHHTISRTPRIIRFSPVFSRFDYGCMFYGGLCDEAEETENSFIRSIFGVPRLCRTVHQIKVALLVFFSDDNTFRLNLFNFILFPHLYKIPTPEF